MSPAPTRRDPLPLESKASKPASIRFARPLRPQSVFGYISDNPKDDPSDQAEFYLTQYTLAPAIVTSSILGKISDRQLARSRNRIRKFFEAKHLTVVAEFWKRRPPLPPDHQRNDPALHRARLARRHRPAAFSIPCAAALVAAQRRCSISLGAGAGIGIASCLYFLDARAGRPQRYRAGRRSKEPLWSRAIALAVRARSLAAMCCPWPPRPPPPGTSPRCSSLPSLWPRLSSSLIPPPNRMASGTPGRSGILHARLLFRSGELWKQRLLQPACLVASRLPAADSRHHRDELDPGALGFDRSPPSRSRSCSPSPPPAC